MPADECRVTLNPGFHSGRYHRCHSPRHRPCRKCWSSTPLGCEFHGTHMYCRLSVWAYPPLVYLKEDARILRATSYFMLCKHACIAITKVILHGYSHRIFTACYPTLMTGSLSTDRNIAERYTVYMAAPT
jgi:hypothetical protein